MANNSKFSVDVLLSTYNGERYLLPFLNSLADQTFTDWKLIVRDDCSRDNSAEIVRKFSSCFPDKVFILAPCMHNLGVQQSFSLLMANAKSQYVMFADQDDIWLPKKIELMFAAIRDLEANYGLDIPLLVHSDLTVVDECLNVISPSFWSFQNIHSGESKSMKRLLVQNYVTGCSTIVNRELCKLALPIPHHAALHDWWCALVASAFGQIGVLEESTILYRQHAHNAVGAKRFGFSYLFQKFLYSRDSIPASIAECVLQVDAFYFRFSPILDDKSSQCIRNFLELMSDHFFMRKFFIIKHGFQKSGLLRTLLFYLYI